MSINNLPSITKAVKIAEQIKLIKQGKLDGFSLSTRNLKPAPSHGYMVGMGVGEFEASSLSNEVIIYKLTKMIDAAKTDYIGAWLHEGKIVVEGATRFTRKFTAEMIGRQRNQIAIYDLGNGCDINL